MLSCTSTVSTANLKYQWIVCAQLLYFQHLKGAMSEYNRVFHYERYNDEESHNEIMDVPLCEHFFTRNLKMLTIPDDFQLYGKLGLIFPPFLNCFIQRGKLGYD